MLSKLLTAFEVIKLLHAIFGEIKGIADDVRDPVTETTRTRAVQAMKSGLEMASQDAEGQSKDEHAKVDG